MPTIGRGDLFPTGTKRAIPSFSNDWQLPQVSSSYWRSVLGNRRRIRAIVQPVYRQAQLMSDILCSSATGFVADDSVDAFSPAAC